MSPCVTPDTGSLHDDVIAYFSAVTSNPRTDLFLSILGAAQREPQLDRLRVEIVADRRRPLRTVLELAQLRGQIADSIDLDLITDLLLSAQVYRQFVLRAPALDDRFQVTIDFILAGLVMPLAHRTV